MSYLVNNTYVSKTAKFYMLIFKVDKFYFENPKLCNKWKYFKQGNQTSTKVSAEPLELSQNMWDSMTILEFHDAFSFYSDVTMPLNRGISQELLGVLRRAEFLCTKGNYSAYPQVFHLSSGTSDRCDLLERHFY